MPRKPLLFALLLAISLYGYAQDKLVIAGNPGDFYTTHIVSEKESLYSIGRAYVIGPKQIANYNRINLNDILPIGYTLRIPLTAANFSSNKANDNDEPVYHVAQKGDNLFKLSQRYNKVKISLLREWNDLRTDNVKSGQAIIVGYIPSPKLTQAMATDPNQVFVKPPVVTKPTDPSRTPLDHPNVLDAKKDGSREVKGEMKPLTDDQIMALREAEFKAKRDAQESLDKMPPVIAGPLPKDPPTEFKTPDADLSYSPKQNDEGYFALLFPVNDGSKSFKSDAGVASTFKTNSGLTDRKFYVLMNDVLPGTIVRIVAPNNKSICARVLGGLPSIKNGPSLLLRMSTPAAAALGIKESSFTVTISYAQ
jgi:LysM repeat protein